MYVRLGHGEKVPTPRYGVNQGIKQLS
jgi:hypothetical protein